MPISKFVEHVDLETIIRQFDIDVIGKAAHIEIKHMDGNMITVRLQNGVQISLYMDEDGSISLSGWTTKSGDNPVFDFYIVDKNGRAVESPCESPFSECNVGE